MRLFKYFFFFAALTMFACHGELDIESPSDLDKLKVGMNAKEVNSLVMGNYAGMRKPLETEWMLTELRSDNSIQGSRSSTTVQNMLFNDLDMFRPSATHTNIYEYWYQSYKNVEASNNVLRSIANVEDSTLQAQYKGEALFIRSHHFFNLVRLFGPIFLPTTVLTADEAKQQQRIAVSVVYNTIINDLQTAAQSLPERYDKTELGRATSWAAKTLLAKVYLTLEEYAQAQVLLEDIVNNSHHRLLPNYADVFSIENEMNDEIIFAVRYMSGSVGMGSPFANMFAALNSGTEIVNGTTRGYNYPSTSIRSAYVTADSVRFNTCIGVYTTAAATRPYVRKYWSYVLVTNDAENDWPILRYSDVLLMLSEVKVKQGIPANGMAELNEVRERAGAPKYTPIQTISDYEEKLLLERRLEFAFENQRWFDLVRTGRAAEIMSNHIFKEEYNIHYGSYTEGGPYSSHKIVEDWQLLLPIPQREIDTNNKIHIVQNVGY